ncbi:MAG: hypothetical protein ACRD1T_27840, partial [Acidimicrobiia bacterium]
MISFRSARDETNIAQLVGRMVRAPLARRVDSDEFLNTVALYLPHYDRKSVEKVVSRLTSDPSAVPPMQVREGKTIVQLRRASGSEALFQTLASLPSYTVPRVKALKPVVRLGKLASLLADAGISGDPVKAYRAKLTDSLLEQHKRIAKTAAFKKKVDEAAVLDIRKRRVKYLDKSNNNGSPASRARVADENVEDLYAEAGRLLTEGLHKEFVRQRVKEGVKPRKAKLEIAALITSNGVLEQVEAQAYKLTNTWIESHKAAFSGMDEKYRQQLRDIEGSTNEPQLTALDPPSSIEWTRGSLEWPKHLYVEHDGLFRE